MESCLKESKVWLDPLHEKYSACEAAGDTYSNKRQECNKKQKDFEEYFCAYAAKLKDTCDAQITCRNNTVPSRNQTYEEVKLSEAGRKAEFETGQQVLCFFKVFEANNKDKPATLSTCLNKTFDSSNYTITYPPEPPPVPCNKEPHQPCDSQFLRTEYEEKSWYNIAPATTCNSCPAVPKPTPDFKCVLEWSVPLHKFTYLDLVGEDPVATCASHCQSFNYFGLACPRGGIHCGCSKTSEYNSASELPKYHCSGECQPTDKSDCPGYKGDGVDVDKNCPGVLIKGQRYRHWNGYTLGASWRVAYYPVPPVTPAPATSLVQGKMTAVLGS